MSPSFESTAPNRNILLSLLILFTDCRCCAGLADRHLENLLVDLKTGAVIQIDFGICFGMGSSLLPVPELIPFRLTPQLRAVLQPLDGVGLLRHYMVQCLQALRADASATGLSPPHSQGHESGARAAGSSAKASRAASAAGTSTDQPPESYSGIIPNALEVYLNDPVVDWLKGPAANKGASKPAARTSTANSTGASAETDPAESAAASMRQEWAERREDMQWEPRRRVHIAVQKLRGADPAHVLLMDLQMNPTVRREGSLRALQAIVTTAAAGGKSDSTSSSARAAAASASAAGDILSVGEQVDRLINIATDPDVLVRHWGGLQTWL